MRSRGTGRTGISFPADPPDAVKVTATRRRAGRAKLRSSPFRPSTCARFSRRTATRTGGWKRSSWRAKHRSRDAGAARGHRRTDTRRGRGGGWWFSPGPSFAREVARRATAVVAPRRTRPGPARTGVLSHSAFRVYTSPDPRGVQIAAALKNVVRSRRGVEDGLGFGANALAALSPRGLAEISRLGVRLGARRETFMGLAGLGDLVLTCTGRLSRNRRVGQLLGQGRRLDEILGEMTMWRKGGHLRRRGCSRQLWRRHADHRAGPPDPLRGQGSADGARRVAVAPAARRPEDDRTDRHPLPQSCPGSTTARPTRRGAAMARIALADGCARSRSRPTMREADYPNERPRTRGPRAHARRRARERGCHSNCGRAPKSGSRRTWWRESRRDGF